MSRTIKPRRPSDTAKVWRPPRGHSAPRPSLAAAILVIGLLAGILLMRVHYKTANVLSGYRMARMQEDRRQLLGDQALLRVEKNTLERLERVERLATAEGLVFPRTDQRIFVEMSGLEGTP